MVVAMVAAGIELSANELQCVVSGGYRCYCNVSGNVFDWVCLFCDYGVVVVGMWEWQNVVD